MDARYVEIVASSMYSYAFSRERFEEMCERGADDESVTSPGPPSRTGG